MISAITDKLPWKRKEKPEKPAKKEIPPLVVHKVPTSLQRLRIDLYTAVDQDATLMKIIDRLCDQLIKVAWSFPASEKTHHTNYTGLIEHSLSVAGKMAVAFKGHGAVAQVTAIITGIGHDLGKVCEWVVDTQRYTYSPFYDSLLNFPRAYSLTAKRDGFGYKESPWLSVALLQRLLPEDFYTSCFFDPIEYALCCEAICMHHNAGSTRNRYLLALVEADGDDASTSAEHEVLVREVEAAGGVDEAELAKVDAFKKAVRTMAFSKEKKIRYGVGHCFVNDPEGVLLALHESVFFYTSTSGSSAVEYLRKKKDIDLSQDACIDLLMDHGLLLSQQRGTMYVEGAPNGAMVKWFFFRAKDFIDPTPGDGYPNHYRTFVSEEGSELKVATGQDQATDTEPAVEAEETGEIIEMEEIAEF